MNSDNYKMDLYKGAKQYGAITDHGIRNQQRQHAHFNANSVGLIGASCMLFCGPAWATQGTHDSSAAQPPAIVQSRQLDLNVSKGILLAATTNETNGTSPAPADANALPGVDISDDLELGTINVRAKRFYEVGPLPGLGLTKEQIPGNVQTITAEDIKAAQSLSISDLLNSKLQSVNVNDYQGNPFQMDVTYRGFTASPQIGTPQGLSVFFDGIRVNEPFGDVVNWDLLPMNAISGINIFPGSNPIFGLNTLGGALAIKTKSGFDSPGVSAQILKGSFGRDQLLASGGWNNGSLAAFGAVSLFMEDGWRDNSPSKVNQGFGKLEWQGERASLAFSSLAAVTKLVGNGTVPIEFYKQDRESVFTSPDETRNRLLQFQLSGIFDVSDTFNITGMVYNRDSRRTSSTGDVIDADTFRDLGRASTNPAPGQEVTCALQDNNEDGYPDYYIYDQTALFPGFFNQFDTTIVNYLLGFPSGTVDYSAIQGTLNQTLPEDYKAQLLEGLYSNSGVNTAPGDSISASPLTKTGYVTSANFAPPSYYQDRDDPNLRHYIFYAPASNASTCLAPTGQLSTDGTKFYPLDENGVPIIESRDGAVDGSAGGLGNGTGVVAGTPTGIISNSLIDQSTTGGALQLNWNLDQHKFMAGISIDRARASYDGKQRFGLIDDSHNVYSDPNNIGAEYYARDHDITINEFDGKSLTKSIYFSETWTPTETLNFAFSSRYNHTDVTNNLAPASRNYSLANGNLLNRYPFAALCTNGVCPFDLSKPLTPEDYKKYIGTGDGKYDALLDTQKEKFSYHSLNPSIGATWQATPSLNLYTNWNQGTRVPSVIELGCAYEGQLVRGGTDNQGNPILVPQSVRTGRPCSLPTALSGDPYLPQVVAQTFEVGARGQFKNLLEWNISAYQTNLRDDIYMTAATSDLSYFQNVGDTRRRGIEFGLSGEYGKSDFSINYSLTEATFQSAFKTLSPNNSSTLSNVVGNPLYNQIQVNPGDFMPGVPLNNLNLSWGYRVTPAFKIGFNVVAHSGSFLRGNENNEHAAGPGKGVGILDSTGVARFIPTPDYNYDGKAPGYAILNFRSTYDLGKGWTLGAIVNNVLDKEYYTAGRLGLNPFSPSINGAIGPGGFNYNSSEWISSQFVSGGAPRGVWVTLGYDFDASKKGLPLPSPITRIEPDRTLEPASTPLPTKEELEVAKALDGIKALPVLGHNLAQASNARHVAEQEVAATVEAWKTALENNDAKAYLQSYAPTYSGGSLSRQAWEEQRKLQLATAGKATVEIADMVIAPQGKRMSAFFTQTYRVGDTQKTSNNILYLEQQNGRWLIIDEQAFSTLQVEAHSPPVQPSAASNVNKVSQLHVQNSMHRAEGK